MPHGVISHILPASAARVFEVLHDYTRRLEWDPLLQEATLTDGWQQAQLHATSLCVGRRSLGGLPLKTRYISFSPGKVAAVKMINRPPLFETFAASIRHADLPDGTSRLTYAYNFTARPRWLRPILHPLISLAFSLETHRRLASLRRYLTKNSRTSDQVSVP
ncbi:MAG: SRPBCC family protein [Planctomycetales bacterium]